MQRSLRHQTIIQALPRSGRISVDALCRLTGASPVTIRRDLSALEAQGALTRRHGGAVLPAKRGASPPFAVRLGSDHERKHQLAAAVAALVEDDEALVLDNGTTCYAVAQHLVGRPITALALSLHAAVALAARPGPRVIVPGGPVETDSLAFVGAAALDAVRAVSADVAVLGACSASASHGLTSTTYEDAEIKRACLASARRTVLATTADKLTRTSTFRFGAPADLTHLVTTADATAEDLAVFTDAGVDVVLVP